MESPKLFAKIGVKMHDEDNIYRMHKQNKVQKLNCIRPTEICAIIKHLPNLQFAN